MPIIHVTIVEGRDDATIEHFIRSIARTTADALDVPLNTVRIAVHQVPPNHFSVGDRLKSE